MDEELPALVLQGDVLEERLGLQVLDAQGIRPGYVGAAVIDLQAVDLEAVDELGRPAVREPASPLELECPVGEVVAPAACPASRPYDAACLRLEAALLLEAFERRATRCETPPFVPIRNDNTAVQDSPP